MGGHPHSHTHIHKKLLKCLFFHFSTRVHRRTDQRTDQWTDKASHRFACPQLKSQYDEINLILQNINLDIYSNVKMKVCFDLDASQLLGRFLNLLCNMTAFKGRERNRAETKVSSSHQVVGMGGL